MSSPSSSGLVAVIVVFSSLGAVAVVFWTQHLVVLSLAFTATKVRFSTKRSKPKRISKLRYLSPSLSLSSSPFSKPNSDDIFVCKNGRERSEKQKQQAEKEKAKMDKNASDKVFDFYSCHQCFRVSISLL
ncbi:uncharacterized protein DS421_18g618170 [Arachis hypogaea]|nr:uncharacterized protein DS421_18g618170 [Arachis hypogaea]